MLLMPQFGMLWWILDFQKQGTGQSPNELYAQKTWAKEISVTLPLFADPHVIDFYRRLRLYSRS